MLMDGQEHRFLNVDCVHNGHRNRMNNRQCLHDWNFSDDRQLLDHRHFFYDGHFLNVGVVMVQSMHFVRYVDPETVTKIFGINTRNLKTN